MIRKSYCVSCATLKLSSTPVSGSTSITSLGAFRVREARACPGRRHARAARRDGRRSRPIPIHVAAIFDDGRAGGRRAIVAERWRRESIDEIHPGGGEAAGTAEAEAHVIERDMVALVVREIEKRIDAVRRRGECEAIRARAAGDQVVAGTAEQNIVVGIAVDGVVAAAADRGLDHGVEGDADIVGEAVAAAEASGFEIDDRRRRPPGEVQRVVHPEAPDRGDRLRVLGEIEVGLDRARDVAVEPEDMVVPRERARCRRAVQPLRRQDVQHHRGDRLDTTAAPIRPGYRIVGIERRVRHRRGDVGHHRPQRHVVGAELPDRGVERFYVALVVGSAMPEPDRVPELMDQGVIEIVAVCESVARAVGYRPWGW